MASRRIERGIDDALLATATWAGFLYVRRRIRRIFSEVTIAVAAGVAVVLTLGAAVAWKRSRTKAPPVNP